MKKYVITEKQLLQAVDACHDAYEWQKSWGCDKQAGEYLDLARDLENQAILTEHTSIDEETKKKLVFELFKMGKYLDLLESTFSVYCEEDAKEMLGNVWQCRDYMEVLLRKL